MASNCIGVTIVTGGAEDWKAFQKHMDRQELSQWEHIDLRKLLPHDPSTSVGHKQDFQVDTTVQAVMASEQFGDVVNDLLDLIISGSYKLFLNCASGWHRASVVGKCLESQANSILGDNGERLINAQAFGLHTFGESWKGWMMQLKNIKEWKDSPWTLMDPHGTLAPCGS